MTISRDFPEPVKKKDIHNPGSKKSGRIGQKERAFFLYSAHFRLATL